MAMLTIAALAAAEADFSAKLLSPPQMLLLFLLPLLLLATQTGAVFQSLGQGYCRGPTDAQHPMGQGVMGRSSPTLLARSDCESFCAGAGASSCVGYTWGTCFASDPSCNTSRHSCALYGRAMEDNIPDGWTAIPEFYNYSGHMIHMHPATTIVQVENEHDGNWCYINCGGACPPPLVPSLPAGSAPGTTTSKWWIVVALATGVAVTIAAIAVATKMRVVEVRFLDSPLISSDNDASDAARPTPTALGAEVVAGC